MFENSTILFAKNNLSETMRDMEAPLVRLTKREDEVLLFLAKGMTRDEIATKLFISAETVKMHTKNIYRKLEAKNKIDALLKLKMI